MSTKKRRNARTPAQITDHPDSFYAHAMGIKYEPIDAPQPATTSAPASDARAAGVKGASEPLDQDAETPKARLAELCCNLARCDAAMRSQANRPSDEQMGLVIIARERWLLEAMALQSELSKDPFNAGKETALDMIVAKQMLKELSSPLPESKRNQ